MEFTKEKTTSNSNLRNMGKLSILFSWLIPVLLVSNLVLAAFFIAKPVRARNGISAAGAIEVYDSDGATPLTSYDFPLFTGGMPGTFTKCFFIKNVGNDPVSVYWNVTGSSIFWELKAAPHLNMYDHYQDGVLKFSFGVIQNSILPTDHWHPDWEAIFLGADEEVELGFELHYTGEPNTAETFAMTISFYAAQPSTVDAAVDVRPSTLNLESRGRWVSCCIELPQGYDVNDIRIGSIRLNDTIPIDHSAPIRIGDCDEDGVPDLAVRFSRASVIEWLCTTCYGKQASEEREVTLKVTGDIEAAMIKGYDIIRIIA